MVNRDSHNIHMAYQKSLLNENTRTVKIKQLFPGQKVVIANDSRPAEVIKRIKKNLYLINLGETEVEVVRQLIAVNVNGLSKFGPYNTTDTPSTTPDTPSITKEENNEEDDRDDTGQDEPIDYRSQSEKRSSDRLDYARRKLESGEWDQEQAAEYRMGA